MRISSFDLVEEAERVACEMNQERLGLSPMDVAIIVARSMALK